MAERKTTDRHLEVLRQQVAAYNSSPTALVKWFQDAENGERFRFEPITLSRSRIDVLVNGIDPQELVELRKKYLADFDDCPLSHKKMRVLEIIEMYHRLDAKPVFKLVDVYEDGKRITKEVAYTDADIIELKQDLLKQIQSEMGDALEKLRGDTTITIINHQERFNERLARALDIGSNVIGRNN